MTTKRKILIGVIVVIAGLQFIRPEKNDGLALGADDIAHTINVPADVQNILNTSCNDCHSNHTEPMWYMNIQPVGLWIGHHIEEGKRELNFSIFKTYKPKRQAHKMEEVAEMVESLEMPMSSYTLMHGNAKLSKEQQELLINWAKAAHDSLKLKIEPHI